MLQGKLVCDVLQVTTDWTKNGGTGCTESHSGTSAAAPIASSLIGLMLQARPCLTWRDVQYIIAVSAVKVSSRRCTCVINADGETCFCSASTVLDARVKLEARINAINEMKVEQNGCFADDCFRYL